MSSTTTRGRSTPRKHRQVSSSENSPSPFPKRCRRSSNGKLVNYDMKYHPMDDVLRPGVVALRQTRKSDRTLRPRPILKKPEQKRTLKDSTLPEAITDPATGLDAGSALPSPVNHGNIQLERLGKTEKQAKFDPLALPLPNEFRRMEGLDQHLYVLQEGAPIKGATLPMSWPEVIEKLRGADLVTIRQLQAWGGTKALKSRYAAICDKMNELFGVPNQQRENPVDWIVRRVEGSHVLKQEPGTKYWTHHEDSVVGIRETLLYESASPSSAQVEPADHDSSHVVSVSDSFSSSNVSGGSSVSSCRAQQEDQTMFIQHDDYVRDKNATDAESEFIDSLMDVANLTNTTESSSPPIEEQFEAQFNAIVTASAQDHDKVSSIANSGPHPLQEQVRSDPSFEHRISLNSPIEFSKHCASDRPARKNSKRPILENAPAKGCKFAKSVKPKSDSPGNDSAKENHVRRESSPGAATIETIEHRGRSRVVYYRPDPRHESLPTGSSFFVPTTVDPRHSRFMALNLRTGKEGPISDIAGDIVQ